MSDDVTSAANVEAPRDTRVHVLASVVAASSEIELADVAKGEPGTDGEGLGWYTFHADGADVYLIFGDGETAVAAPVIGAVDPAAGRAWKIRADQEKDFKITQSTRVFRHIDSTTGGFLRYYRSSK